MRQCDQTLKIVGSQNVSVLGTVIIDPQFNSDIRDIVSMYILRCTSAEATQMFEHACRYYTPKQQSVNLQSLLYQVLVGLLAGRSCHSIHVFS